MSNPFSLNLDITLQRFIGLNNLTLQRWVEQFPDASPWRVSVVERGRCEIVGVVESADLQSAPSLPSPYRELGPICQDLRLVTAFAELPKTSGIPTFGALAVGDWVHLRDTSDILQVAGILPRSSKLSRTRPGGVSDEQLIAANVDTVFIVVAFAPTEKLTRRALNSGRLQRFLWLVRQGGSEPVVVLNKSDLTADAVQAEVQLARELGQVPLITLSAHSEEQWQALLPFASPGTTVAFVGPSGVGKSTLINRLIGREAQDTGGVRIDDAKGRHTTTQRKLLLTTAGAVLIDTPGLREVALFSDDGEAVGFDDVARFAQQCKFTDCAHGTEPGCAVRAAVRRGELDEARLRSYESLARDAQRQAARHDAQARHLQRQHYRKLNKVYREAKAKRAAKRSPDS